MLPVRGAQLVTQIVTLASARHAGDADERVLPRNLEAERSVLGAILLHNETYGAAAAIVDSTDFFRDAHSRIFRKMAALAERHEQIDLVTLREELGRDLDDVGGPAYISALIDGVPRSSSVAEYARIIKEKSVLRRIIFDATKTLTLAYEGQIAPAELLSVAQQNLGAIVADVSTIDEFAGTSLLDDVELMTLPDPEFVVDAVIQRRGLTVVYGPPGGCKTTLIAGLTVSIATKLNWHGHVIRRPGHSVYVAAEDASGFKVRLSAAKRAAGIALDTAIGVYTFPEPIDLRDPSSVNRFMRLLKSRNITPEVVVVDTYASATPGASENSSEDTTTSMAAAQRIRDGLDCSVILVHHSNAGGSRERGHSSMRGAADTMISVTPVDDVVHVECSKQRNGAPFETLVLKLVPLPDGGFALRHAADVIASDDLTQNQAKVLSILRDTFAVTGATKTEWRSACQDVAERTFHRSAKILVERGLVGTSGSHFRVADPEAL
jgi:hypothetical protein